jgi:hypothetical protein
LVGKRERRRRGGRRREEREGKKGIGEEKE